MKELYNKFLPISWGLQAIFRGHGVQRIYLEFYSQTFYAIGMASMEKINNPLRP